ncbi:hypothetical protein MUK42_07964 [Musa troglodytarum]|uniref:Uncharacterized protein n=1 Tax=Musa troglodytarum TaxID=320322 RepID=A0A9E7EYW2_9LILI|nr:hypothetical protein MUK42_07964 [Musa troglodytarum]
MSFLVYLFGEIVFQLAVLRSTALDLPCAIYIRHGLCSLLFSTFVD